MPTIRQPAVSGLFYPGGADALRRSLAELLAQADDDAAGPPPKALIVPHAGYVYSGPTAARAYRRLVPVGRTIRRVVLLGPSHRVWLEGMAVSSAAAFATPLGRIPVDREAVARIVGMPGLRVSDAAHVQEHSLEVQLPFLQAVLEDFKLVPIAVGNCPAERVGAVIDALWGGPETLIVVSSDLSHFLSYEQARAADARTRDRIMAHATNLSDQEACGARAINGLMAAEATRELVVENVDLCSSGDTAGDRERVVGYGSFVLPAGAASGGR
jgi:AmmeMemoRadiSam system protein B